MPIIATETNHRLSNVVKRYLQPDFPEFSQDLAIANETAITTYPIGTVLGKVTTTGKYKISKPAATDGSEVPSAIYIGTGDALGAPVPTTLAANTDAKVLVLARWAVVSSAGIVLDATINSPTLRATAYQALKNAGIFVEAAV